MKLPGNRAGHILVILAVLLFASVVLNIVLLLQLQNGSVVSVVYDGDSFELADGRRVRLLGVDAPEKGRCGYEEAKNELSLLVLGKKVRLKNIIVDDYGRLVANVIVEDFGNWTKYITWWLSQVLFSVRGWVTRVGGSPPAGVPSVGGRGGKPEAGPQEKEMNFLSFDPMVNRRMVALGLAKNLSVASPYKKALDEAGADAKGQGLGIYSAQCRSLVAQDNCRIKANITQGKKEYYPPGCKTYNQVIVDLSFGDQWMCSEGDAIDKGYTKAQSCR